MSQNIDLYFQPEHFVYISMWVTGQSHTRGHFKELRASSTKRQNKV